MIIEFKKLSENGIVPTKGSDGAAGYDLYSTEDYVLKYGERKLFKTNISMSIPPGFYGRIAPRSGLAYKQGLDVMAGVIDSDYRNDIGVILINLKTELSNYKDGELYLHSSLMPQDVIIKKNDRIAQIIIESYNDIDFREVEDLEDSIRSMGGFGSTDVKQ